MNELVESIVPQNWVDPRGYLYDDPTAAWSPVFAGVNLRSDRAGGQDRPIFETETQLAVIRAVGRFLSSRYAAGVAAIDLLSNYTIGSGYDYQCRPTRDDAETRQIAAAVAVVVDTFLDDNDWSAGPDGGLESELHNRSRIDGEFFLALNRVDGWRCRASVIEPAFVAEPADPRALEEYYGVLYPSSWRFGVHVRDGEPERAIGYHVVRNESGTDWDYLPASRVVHYRRNVPRNVVRGVSDFYPIDETLRQHAKLQANTFTGAAVQAAIAYVVEHAPTTTYAAATSAQSLGAYRIDQRSTPNGTQSVTVKDYRPGTVVETSAGRRYVAGPMGTERARDFVEVIQAAIRAAAARWAIPEYMLSADASNANYASTLAAESPFVQARTADQRRYARVYRNAVWAAVRIAYDGGYFARFGLPWDAIQRAVEIVVTPPKIVARDPLSVAQTNEIEMRNGVLSRRTWATEVGRDYDEEMASGAKPSEPSVATPQIVPAAATLVASPDPTPLANTALNGAQVASATEIVRLVALGQLPRDSGIGMLMGLFDRTRDQAEMMMGSAGTSTPTTQNPGVATALQSSPTVESAGPRRSILARAADFLRGRYP